MRESKASGRTDTSAAFNQWYRSRSAQDLELQICSSKNISSAFKQLGGRAGTWLFPEMAWGYCEYLSSEFHLAVLSSFDNAVNGDGDKAVREFKRRVKTSKLINSLDAGAGKPAPVNRVEGGNDRSVQGTWVHPDVALAYSAWVDIIHQF
ncbi:KilA-N domain-containing protein [Salmonella enterica]